MPIIKFDPDTALVLVVVVAGACLGTGRNTGGGGGCRVLFIRSSCCEGVAK